MDDLEEETKTTADASSGGVRRRTAATAAAPAVPSDDDEVDTKRGQPGSLSEDDYEDDGDASTSEEGTQDEEAPQLSMSQTETLLHYQQISGLELPQCRRQLEQADWNLMRATDKLFGQLPGTAEGNNSATSQQQQQQQQQQSPPPAPPPTLAADSRARVVTGGGGGGAAAPAAAAANNRQVQPLGWLGWLEGLLLLPFRFVGHSVGSVLRFVLSILRPVAAAQRRPVLDPVGDVRRFVTQFEQQFGAGHPPVRVCSYSQALDAARTELRFLLVYLHAESHQDTEQFCRQVLVSDVFGAFLQASGINFWMCSVSSPEGGRVSQALRETSYPFLALIVLKQARMTVVARFEGLLTLEQLLAELDAAVTDFEPYLTEERARRQSLEMNRRLIEEQDQAYAEALARDREREQRRLAEEAERSAETAATERRLAEQRRELDRLRDLLPPEPPSDCTEAVVKLSVRMPGAHDRLERRFRLSEPVEHLHYFVRLQECAPHQFALCTSFPKREIPAEGVTFAEAGLTQSEVLFVTDNDD